MQLEFEWGDWIAHGGGAQPEWLDDGERVFAETATMIYKARLGDDPLNWYAVERFQVRSSHPYYLAVSRGFTYWAGGENAPDDWDGGPVLGRDGRIMRTRYTPLSWQHPHMPVEVGAVRDGDIIGYHKKPAAPLLPAGKMPDHPHAPDWAFKIACDIVNADGSSFTVDGMKETSLGKAFAHYIAEHEDEPPVDPDVAAVRQILSAYIGRRIGEDEAERLRSGGDDDSGRFIAALDVYRGIKAGGQ